MRERRRANKRRRELSVMGVKTRTVMTRRGGGGGGLPFLSLTFFAASCQRHPTTRRRRVAQRAPDGRTGIRQTRSLSPIPLTGVPVLGLRRARCCRKCAAAEKILLYSSFVHTVGMYCMYIMMILRTQNVFCLHYCNCTTIT